MLLGVILVLLRRAGKYTEFIILVVITLAQLDQNELFEKGGGDTALKGEKSRSNLRSLQIVVFGLTLYYT